MAAVSGLVLIAVFGGLAILGIPLAISIVAAAFASVLLVIPPDMALFTSAQKMVASLDSFLAVGCFPFSFFLE